MDKEQVAVATISWARDEQEEGLLRESLTKLAELNIPVYITDGGSGADFLDFLTGFPHFKILKADLKGVWAQARKSLEEAYLSGANFILYTEPDKYDFFNSHLSQFISEAPDHDQVGIILASRSAEGFSSFPEFQQTTETTINQCCQEVIGKAVDYTYGPFLLNRNLVPYYQKVQEDIGWGWRPYTFGIAHRLQLQIESQIKDFYCPPDQREDTKKERIYRMRQLNQNIQGLVLSTSVSID